jgi:hypothetical protein
VWTTIVDEVLVSTDQRMTWTNRKETGASSSSASGLVARRLPSCCGPVKGSGARSSSAVGLPARRVASHLDPPKGSSARSSSASGLPGRCLASRRGPAKGSGARASSGGESARDVRVTVGPAERSGSAATSGAGLRSLSDGWSRATGLGSILGPYCESATEGLSVSRQSIAAKLGSVDLTSQIGAAPGGDCASAAGARSFAF